MTQRELIFQAKPCLNNGFYFKNDWQTINPQLPNLHCLAEYVIKSNKPEITNEIKDYPYWFDYENLLNDDKTIKNQKELESVILQKDNNSENP